MLNNPDVYQIQGDTVRSLDMQLITADGPTDLTLALAVSLRLKPDTPTGATSGFPCVIVDAAKGLVRYIWPNNSTETTGDFLFQVEVTYPGNRLDTYPQGNKQFYRLRRVPRL